jgi:protease I
MKYFFSALIILLIACGSKKNTQQIEETIEPDTAQITGSVLIVIAPGGFRDEEFREPYDLFTRSGVKVTIASTDTAPAKGMLGMIVRPQIVISGVDPEDYDALVLVGGSGCRVLWDNEVLHSIVRRFNDEKKTVSAICIAPVILARAKVLEGKKATVYPDVKDEITLYDAQYTGSDIETCGNIITGSGPHAARDFAEAVLKSLAK